MLRYLRDPDFLLPIVLFPTVFYVMFGLLLNHGNDEASRYMLASYSTFGVMAPGLFGFGVSLALERDSGLLTLKRALPMPPLAYLLGKMAMAMLMAAIVMAVLLSLGLFAAHVPLTAMQAGAMLATGVFGVLPFCALGLLVGTLAKGQAAPGVVNLVYLPMSFLSGLWLPLAMLPKSLSGLPSPSLSSAPVTLESMSCAPPPALPSRPWMLSIEMPCSCATDMTDDIMSPPPAIFSCTVPIMVFT